MTQPPRQSGSSGESLLEFPCDLDIKAVGKSSSEFPNTILELVQKHAPEVGMQSLRSRESSGGKYISVTITLYAQSKDQMDRIYSDMTAHPDILTAL